MRGRGSRVRGGNSVVEVVLVITTTSMRMAVAKAPSHQEMRTQHRSVVIRKFGASSAVSCNRGGRGYA